MDSFTDVLIIVFLLSFVALALSAMFKTASTIKVNKYTHEEGLTREEIEEDLELEKDEH